MPANKPSAKGKARKPDAKRKVPGASRPNMPSGYHIPESTKGILSWSWANRRLAQSHNYLITTVRSNGRPHSMVIWGIWLDNAYYFSTGAETRKAKNLADNPHCVICTEDMAEAVIVEGAAQRLEVTEIPRSAFRVYQKKYGWKLDPEMGPVFKISPSVVFAMPEETFPKGATRWIFR